MGTLVKMQITGMACGLAMWDRITGVGPFGRYEL